ncbi:MAG: hypothetical protein ABI873_02100 [Marmoricola sp.]
MLTSVTVRRALVALLLAVPLVATGGTAQAAACSGSTGVTVVVQFPDGHTQTGCAPGDPSSGTSALTSAGFSYTLVTGQAFVCQINSAPESTCARIPPANAYWAYFHAKRGGSWSYSSTGATSYDPAPGSVEGWRFGNGAKPSTAPPGAATPKPTPTPKPKPAPKPTTKPSPASNPAATASAGPSTKGSTTAGAARTKAVQATAKARSSVTAAAKAKATARKAAVAEAKASVSAAPADQPSTVAAPLVHTAPDPQQHGGNVPWLWGLAGLVVVGGAAGAVTFARRH